MYHHAKNTTHTHTHRGMQTKSVKFKLRLERFSQFTIFF